jgi:hypothetical protein
MIDQGDAQPKVPCQRELVNLGCLLPYPNHQRKCQNVNKKKKKCGFFLYCSPNEQLSLTNRVVALNSIPNKDEIEEFFIGFIDKLK